MPAEMPKGGMPYQYFTCRPNFKEDRWVERPRPRPARRQVVHHIIVFIVPPGERFIARAVHGRRAVRHGAGRHAAVMLPEGMAKKVPAGSKLVFQMHYTPNGKARRRTAPRSA